MKRSWLAVLLALSASAGFAQSTAVFKIDYSNPGLDPNHWTLTLNPDGTGHFHADRADPAGQPPAQTKSPLVDRDIRVSAAFAGSVFLAAERHKFFNIDCDNHMKVAFEGWKRLSYAGPDGEGTCEFNFAKDKEIQELGVSLVSVANTLIEGARLESLLHHDPLGLDKEMEYLVTAAQDGRAQQIVAIRGVLEHLADDENVLDRVRKRARMLLAMAGN